MKSSIVTCFMALLLCIAVSAQETKPIELTISIPGLGEKEFIVGEAISLQVTLKNTSSGPIYILPPLDGSTYGRYPRYTQTVIRPLPVDYVSDGLICGTFNPLRHEDFVLLQAGESYILPSPFFDWKPYTAGEYEVSLRIDFNGTPEQFRAPVGDYVTPDPELLEKLNQVPKVDIESNRVKVNVVSNGRTSDPTVHCLMGMPMDELKRMFNEVEEIEDEPRLYKITGMNIGVVFHFDTQWIVDGVKSYTYDRSLIVPYSHWLSGTNPKFPTIPIYFITCDGLEGAILEAGYFAPQIHLSSIDFADFYK